LAKIRYAVPVRLIGTACILLGILVIAGWYLDVPGLVRLRADFPAMQALTAAGFAVSGLGLLAGWRVPRARAACAAIALGIGLVTIFHFFFDLPAAVGAAFAPPGIQGGAVRPRAIAPNSALAFCFAGVGLLAAGRTRTAVAAVAAALAGAGVAALAAQDLVRFAGEAAGIWTATNKQMAAHSALAFLAIGCALMLEARAMTPVEENVRMRRALAVGLLALGATLTAGQLIRGHQATAVKTTTRTVGEMLARELQSGSAEWQRVAILHGRQTVDDLERRLAMSLGGAAPGYVLEVTQAGRRPFRRGEDGPAASVQFIERVPLRLAGGEAMLSLWPSRALLQSQRRPLALAIMLLGSALAVLLAVSMQAWETAQTRARRLETALATIAGEVRERRRAEAALADSEQRLQQSRKMEAVGRLAGGVAHEFNNLLSVIAGYGQLVAVADEEQERRAYASEIDHAAQRGVALTQRLLTMSARHVHHPEVLDLGTRVDGMRTTLAAVLDAGIELRIDIEEAGDLRVSVDPERLEHAILTLATNANAAMGGSGRLRVSVRRRTLEARFADALGVRDGPYVELAVADDGKGMGPEELRAIFEPFGGQQLGHAGGGLGLAMLYGFIRQSGGAVDVTSTPGNGARFRLLFPAAPQPAPAAPAAVPPVPERRDGTVLLAEDEDALRRLVERVLERAGYSVLAARNGAEALARARQHDGAIDLLVTDVVMPGLGGAELAEMLRARQPGLPVLFMSGYTDAEIAAGVGRVPGSRFIQKPFTMGDLLARAAELLADADAVAVRLTPHAAPSSV
jgi:signal transduction histidine kinase/ActR/RegA family two-component response regulator